MPSPFRTVANRSNDDPVVQATLTNSLDALDSAENYRDWIMDLARPFLTAPILEVGAGHGTFTDPLAEIGPVLAVEPGAQSGDALEQRFRDDPRVTISRSMIGDVPIESSFGSAITVNVLEHIPDDAEALREINARLSSGGHIVIWVPAFQMLYSQFDHVLGHVKRYRKPELERLLSEAGFEITEGRYVNFPGWFSWLIMVKIMRQQPTGSLIVRIFDKILVPAIRWAESRVRPPFGQSIFLVARKP